IVIKNSSTLLFLVQRPRRLRILLSSSSTTPKDITGAISDLVCPRMPNPSSAPLLGCRRLREGGSARIAAPLSSSTPLGTYVPLPSHQTSLCSISF
ncbi:hypothetical protein BHE74_00050656, partial [Ensete ventricosum]